MEGYRVKGDTVVFAAAEERHRVPLVMSSNWLSLEAETTTRPQTWEEAIQFLSLCHPSFEKLMTPDSKPQLARIGEQIMMMRRL